MSADPLISPEAWVDTAAVLAQARTAERTGALRDAEAAFDAVIVAPEPPPPMSETVERIGRALTDAHRARFRLGRLLSPADRGRAR